MQAKEKKERKNINASLYLYLSLNIISMEEGFYQYIEEVLKASLKRKNLTILKCRDDLYNFWVHVVICQFLWVLQELTQKITAQFQSHFPIATVNKISYLYYVDEINC